MQLGNAETQTETSTTTAQRTTTALWSVAAQQLTEYLGLRHAPVAVRFSTTPPEGVDLLDAPMSAPTPDGRAGRAPASCVFWTEVQAPFVTAPEDHGNCSVGQLTHGMASVAQLAGRNDVNTLLDTGWVSETDIGAIPRVGLDKPWVTYARLADSPVDPDVVMLRLNGVQLMTLRDAVPDLVVSGKPQCQIIPLAREQSQIAASVGCALSRERCDMADDELSCALPAHRLGEVVEHLQVAVRRNSQVAEFARADAERFPRA